MYKIFSLVYTYVALRRPRPASKNKNTKPKHAPFVPTLVNFINYFALEIICHLYRPRILNNVTLKCRVASIFKRKLNARQFIVVT